MEHAVAVLVGFLFAAAVFMLLSGSIIRLLLGVFVLGNATHLLIFVSGRLSLDDPPLVPSQLYAPDSPIANPLPQALILTAIVISFALFSFLLVLGYRAYEELKTVRTAEMRDAEPIVDESALLRGRDV